MTFDASKQLMRETADLSTVNTKIFSINGVSEQQTGAMASEREKYDKPKSNSSVKHIPKDAQVIMSIMKELNVTDYEPRVINQLLEFTYRMYCMHSYWHNLINQWELALNLYLLDSFRIRHLHFG